MKALVISVTSFAGRDATPDTQKEEIANTKEKELYEVTTSCGSQKRGINVEMEESNLYEAPTSMIKMAERDVQKKKRSIEMKEDVVYEVPPQ